MTEHSNVSQDERWAKNALAEAYSVVFRRREEETFARPQGGKKSAKRAEERAWRREANA